MLTLEKLSKWMKFFNQIALSVIVGSVAIAIVWMLAIEAYGSFKHRHKNDPVTVKAPIASNTGSKSEITLHVGYVHKVGDLWLADILEPQDSYDTNVVYRSSSSITRNVVMSSVNSDKVRLLFNDYTNKLNSFETLPEEGSAKVIVCKYVKNFKNDIDEDLEKPSLLLLSIDGSKQKTIIEDVDRILKVEIAGKDELHAIYFKDGKLVNSKFSIKDFSEISSPRIFDLRELNIESNIKGAT